MRGEDLKRMMAANPGSGSPPHARGRPEPVWWQVEAAGITPACAGKTRRPARRSTARPDHPRMRGEDTFDTKIKSPENGSPPHARGRPQMREYIGEYWRITPACAGKTCGGSQSRHGRRDHPRMRGEDAARLTAACSATGSPPHARGRHKVGNVKTQTKRITPACAGKTLEACNAR